MDTLSIDVLNANYGLGLIPGPRPPQGRLKSNPCAPVARANAESDGDLCLRRPVEVSKGPARDRRARRRRIDLEEVSSFRQVAAIDRERRRSSARVTSLTFRPEVGRDYPLNLSILLSEGKENNEDSLKFVLRASRIALVLLIEASSHSGCQAHGGDLRACSVLLNLSIEKMTAFQETLFKIIQCPTEENLNMTNCAILNEGDISKFSCLESAHIEVKNKQGKMFTTFRHSSIEPGSIGLSQLQMKWAGLKTGDQVVVDQFRSKKALAQEVSFEIGISTPATDSSNCLFTNAIKDLQFVISDVLLIFTVKSIKSDGSITSLFQNHKVAKSHKDLTKMDFKASKKSITLIDEPDKGNSNIINPDFDFKNLGIGGLDEKFETIFRQAFASRLCSPKQIKGMGIKHVKECCFMDLQVVEKHFWLDRLGKCLMPENHRWKCTSSILMFLPVYCALK
ncbi:unnamed protein product [Clavelina lepadiformis]|uniref:Vesicle-fusing ATPase n=1 Tax=Clavelina lepadiformis TaxID=159417 RepID=A0ABP0FR37_CLALP